ncbi:S26 family signal peptidase [Candidatus Cyanaurora vandensis]|uniref:S26 family signal peptidase n=1 Tax=Candidatus Cyanaurora vandensis TaxID=2714958 RepID=UPI00257A7705|nr:S26 family signal peptidase [Candidatus Cyanaurora vandensis]
MKEGPRQPGQGWWSRPPWQRWSVAVAFGLVGGWFFTAIVTLAWVEDMSMSPTLPPGQMLILVRSQSPRRGDFYLLRVPESFFQRYPKFREKMVGRVSVGNMRLLKRVVALPGETVLREGKPYQLQAQEYWVRGDNAQTSIDSRVFGVVLRPEFIARAYPLPFARKS